MLQPSPAPATAAATSAGEPTSDGGSHNAAPDDAAGAAAAVQEEAERAASQSGTSQPPRWAGISVNGLSGAALLASFQSAARGAAPAPQGGAQEPRRAAHRLAQLQQSAEKSVLRVVQQHSREMRGSLEASAQSVAKSSELLHTSNAKATEATLRLHELAQGMRSLREGSSMTSLWGEVAPTS